MSNSLAKREIHGDSTLKPVATSIVYIYDIYVRLCKYTVVHHVPFRFPGHYRKLHQVQRVNQASMCAPKAVSPPDVFTEAPGSGDFSWDPLTG